MKTRLLTTMLLSAVFTFLPMAAQTDSLAADNKHVDEIEAFSDTTSLDSASANIPPLDDDFDGFDDDDFFNANNGFHGFWETNGERIGEGVMGMFFVVAVLFILFVLSPIVIIGLILWFIYKSRQNRMRLAEMAMKNGQPIPDELVGTKPTSDGDVREKGVRQVFLGIGLTFLLGWAAGKIGAGIGVLVLCIGLGNLFISRSAKNKQDDFFNFNNQISKHHDTETL